MDWMTELEPAPTQRNGVRTASVMIFLAAFSMIVSWLGVYALTNALIAAELMVEWPRGFDPRPSWMLRSFFGLYFSFGFLGLLFRWLSNRQLRRIDAMVEME